MHNFKNLIIWQKGIELVTEIYFQLMVKTRNSIAVTFSFYKFFIIVKRTKSNLVFI